MPCTRTERQRPQFQPMTFQSRPLIPLGASPATARPSDLTISPTTQARKSTDRAMMPTTPSHLRSNIFSADEIVKGLYLGTSSDAGCLEELERHGIRNVLNVATECEFPEELLQAQARGAITLKKVHMVDHSDHDIAKSFPECNAFILAALQRGEGVVVHCRMGVSRSASVVIAFLMEYGGLYFPYRQRKFEERAAAGASQNTIMESPQHQNISTNPHRVASRDNLCAADGSKGVQSSTAATAQVDFLRSADKNNRFPLTYGDAFDIVKERRNQVAPNLGFCLALREIDVHRGVLGDIWDFSDALCI